MAESFDTFASRGSQSCLFALENVGNALFYSLPVWFRADFQLIARTGRPRCRFLLLSAGADCNFSFASPLASVIGIRLDVF